MRAEKRKKNAPKELARLRATLGQDGKGEITMKDVCETATLVPASRVTERAQDVEMSGDLGAQSEITLQFSIKHLQRVLCLTSTTFTHLFYYDYLHSIEYLF